ncbi:MAG: PRC-barrel domain-containing protein [Eggerthellaceae bacterium]|nr:PRC-barrel domain-containing protein [Eggerthellaceae bacterium]
MPAQLISTNELTGLRVVSNRVKVKKGEEIESTRKIGKVRYCVFHPYEKRFVGLIVKRPDAALMFHRKDLFIAYDAYDLTDGRVVLRPDGLTDGAACKAMNINWDDCVLWVGMPVMTRSGVTLGLVGDIVVERETGAIVTLEVTTGATSNAILGTRSIPVDLIKGFRQGIGMALSTYDEDGEERMLGAILVDDAAKAIPTEGGVAEKAGEATAKVTYKAHEAVESVKPAVSEAAAATGKAVNKGAYVTGRQLVRARGMFSGFKDEYQKASGKKTVKKAVAAGAAASQDDDDFEIVYVDEAGNVIEDYVEEVVIYEDEDGNLVDAEGRLVDEDGNLIEGVIYEDEDGNLVDAEGRLVDEDGNLIFIEEDDEDFDDEFADDELVEEEELDDEELASDEGDEDEDVLYRDEDGNYYDEDGNLVEVVDEDGNPVDLDVDDEDEYVIFAGASDESSRG